MAAAVVAMAALLGTPGMGVARAVADPSCTDVEVVFARGTFEAPGIGATGQAFVDALDTRLGGSTVSVYGVDYPASMDFPRAADGVIDAGNQINAIAAKCPATKIVLGGYSQGAAVAGYLAADNVPDGYALPPGVSGPLAPATAKHVAAVVLFGTPSDGVLHLLAKDAPPITIGSSYASRTLQLCAPADPVCSGGGLDRSAHSAYKDNGMAVQAADFVASTMSNRR